MGEVELEKPEAQQYLRVGALERVVKTGPTI
jgi:hypothetical protein